MLHAKYLFYKYKTNYLTEMLSIVFLMTVLCYKIGVETI